MKTVLSSLTTERPTDAEFEQIIETAINRLQDGQPVDFDQLMAEHPEHAATLRDVFPAVMALVQMADAPQPNAAITKQTDSFPCERLGDFRLIREIGHGGMGTVFEAEQLSMGRSVALKVLPFAALIQDKALQRFRNEVRAAGALDHPNIVAVYSIGEERGVHFYAMQLIRGQTLADMIGQLRKSAADKLQRIDAVSGSSSASRDATTHQETLAWMTTAVHSPKEALYRSAARLGIQAAEALQHAHDQGVLHRDIKPSNLILDREGKLYVTDFGLARIEADAGMTMTGDLLGTLRYMAPEQALAKRVVIDHRADIYSLGATLYELLTLQPAFRETDHRELLKQIAFDEPLPLRKLNGQIPAELETIVLTAMAKDPEARYQTAEQLARDLQAFLDNRPIKARSPSLSDRAWKWSLRHRAIVRIAGLALVLVTAILAVSMARVKRAETRAVAALGETSDLLYEADMSLAYLTFEKGSSDEVQLILDRYGPTGPGPDRRGFEWHLLKKFVQQPSSIALAGHRGPVNELAVFPDRRRLASVGEDGTLRIWDVRSRKLVQTIKICDEGLSSVAISPDGRFIAAGSIDGRLPTSRLVDIRPTAAYLCDLEAGYQVSEVFRGRSTIESLAFTADSKRLALGTRYDEVVLVTRDGQIKKRIPCASRVESLEFVPHSPASLLVPNRRPLEDENWSGIVQVWRHDLSEVTKEFDSSSEDEALDITVARSSPCGRFVAGGERYRSKAFLFDFDANRILAETPVFRDRLTDLAYSPSGKAIAIGYRNGCVEFFDLQITAVGSPSFDRRPRLINAHRGEVGSVGFVNATTLATCGADGLIRIWDMSTQAEMTMNLTDSRMNGMKLSPDGSLVLYVCNDELLMADTETGNITFHFTQPDAEFQKPVWSPLGDRAAICCGHTNTVSVVDRNGRAVCSIAHGARPEGVDLSSNGRLAAIIGPRDLQICNSDNGREVFRQSLRKPGSEVAFSHSGDLLAYGGQLKAIALFDVTEMRTVGELVCDSAVACLAFSPDDSILVTGHGDSIVRVWEVTTGRLRAELVGHQRAVQSLAFSPDGRTLLSSADDGEVRVWSVDHGRGYGCIYRQFEPGSRPAHCKLSLSSDGSRLAVGYRTERDDFPDVLVRKLDLNAAN